MQLEDRVIGPNGEKYIVGTSDINEEDKQEDRDDNLIPLEYETYVYKTDEDNEIVTKDSSCAPFLNREYYTEAEARIGHKAIIQQLKQFDL